MWLNKVKSWWWNYNFIYFLLILVNLNFLGFFVGLWRRQFEPSRSANRVCCERIAVRIGGPSSSPFTGSTTFLPYNYRAVINYFYYFFYFISFLFLFLFLFLFYFYFYLHFFFSFIIFPLFIFHFFNSVCRIIFRNYLNLDNYDQCA